MKRTPAPMLTAKRKGTLLLIAAAALIPTAMLARRVAVRSMPSVDPTVSIERGKSAEASEMRPAVSESGLPDDGEVYRTADRLREASALALAAALRAATAQAESHTIHSAPQLVDDLRSAGLLPPRVTADSSMALHSDRSRLLLRYRRDPLAIEVLSFPHSREDGPALLVRIPSLGSDGDRGSIFIADRLGEIAAPAPFASVSDCVSAGWIDQSFNMTEVPEAQWQQLRSWLAVKRAH
jgi:predicted nucleic acid-binding protein